MAPAADPGSLPWRVRPLAAGDHDRWREHYAAYAAFYRSPLSDDQAGRTWSWLMDPGHPLYGLVVHRDDGPVAGLAHVRPFAEPLTATVACFLDDLYVSPADRGHGAGHALLLALRELAARQGWRTVTWLTAPDNATARLLYDRLAEATTWVTYEMPAGQN